MVVVVVNIVVVVVEVVSEIVVAGKKEFEKFYIRLILIEIINVCEIFNEFLLLFIICIVQILN